MSAKEETAETETDGQTEITLYPLIGFATHTLPDQGVMLTLELPVDSEKPDGERYRLHIGLRSNGTRQLAASLNRAADATDMGQAPTTTKS